MASGGFSSRRVDEILADFLATKRFTTRFTIEDASGLCAKVRQVFRGEPTLMRIEAPVSICGDIHGQMSDLIRAMTIGGVPPVTKWLFLGDYVDRGPESVEVICFLFALKIKFPKHVFLIRGNHECAEMSESFGFMQECNEKLNRDAWLEFCDVFEYLPLAALINNRYFCVHGGISPELDTLDQIARISRPLSIPTKGLILDILWSDPSDKVDTYGPSDRGETVTFGIAPAKKFMRTNKLSKIIRGHQVTMDGYEFPFAPDESVVTMFTAANYGTDMANRAAFMTIDGKLACQYKVLPATTVRKGQRSGSFSGGPRPAISPQASSQRSSRPLLLAETTRMVVSSSDSGLNAGRRSLPRAAAVKNAPKTHPIPRPTSATATSNTRARTLAKRRP